jgi:hypothetical protein
MADGENVGHADGSARSKARGSGLWRRRKVASDPARAFDEATARIRVGLDEARRLDGALSADLLACGRTLNVAGIEALMVRAEQRKAASTARASVHRHLALLVVKIGVRADDVRHALDEEGSPAVARHSTSPFLFGMFGPRSRRGGGREDVAQGAQRASPSVIEQMLAEAEFLAEVIEAQATTLRRLRKQGEADLSVLFDHRRVLRESLPVTAFRRRGATGDSVRSDERMRRALYVEKVLSGFETVIEDWSHGIRLLHLLRHKIAMDAEELLTLHRVVSDAARADDGRLPLAEDRFPHLCEGLIRMAGDRLIGRGLPALRQTVDGRLRVLLGYRRDMPPAAGRGPSVNG